MQKSPKISIRSGWKVLAVMVMFGYTMSSLMTYEVAAAQLVFPQASQTPSFQQEIETNVAGMAQWVWEYLVSFMQKGMPEAKPALQNSASILPQNEQVQKSDQQSASPLVYNVLSTSESHSLPTFSDIAQDPNRESIEILASIGLLKGGNGGKFYPHNYVRCADFIRVLLDLYRYKLGYRSDDQNGYVNISYFVTSIQDSLLLKKLNTAHALGLLEWLGEIWLEKPISPKQALQIINNTLNLSPAFGSKEIKNQISHFFNTIQSNENKIKQIDWLLANANPELLWELRKQKAEIASQQEKLEQLSFSRELQTFYTQYHSILGLGHRENFSLLYNEQFVQELITLGTNLKKANELVASQVSNLTTKQQVEKQKIENQLLNLENQYRFYQEQLQQIEQKLQQFEERVQQEQIFACEKIWANCPFITVINKQHFEQREQEKQQLLSQKQQIEHQISSSQILTQIEECKLTLANWEKNETFLKEHEKLSLEEQDNTKKIWFLKTFLQSINYKQITEASEKYSELAKNIQALDQQILKQEELLAQTEQNQQEKLRLQSENIALQQQYSQGETKKSELEGKIWQLEQNIQKYPVQEWDLIEKTANSYQAKIQELRNLIEDYKTLQLKVKKLTEEEKILSNLYTILNKELLLFVLSEYLPVLSEIINTYLVNVVDYQISIKLKETSEQLELETKIIDSKWEREVKSLSWGQRTILKLVWMLAISSHLKTRLLFLDETINNLDNETVAKVAELLTDFVKQRTLKFYTITHNSDIQSMNIRDSTIELAKRADQ